MADSDVILRGPSDADISLSDPSGLSVYVNVAGTWKQAISVHVNVSGTWKNASGVYTNVAGTWKDSV